MLLCTSAPPTDASQQAYVLVLCKISNIDVPTGLGEYVLCKQSDLLSAVKPEIIGLLENHGKRVRFG